MTVHDSSKMHKLYFSNMTFHVTIMFPGHPRMCHQKS